MYEDSYSIPVYSESYNRGEEYSNDENAEGDSAKRTVGWKQSEDQKLLFLAHKYQENWAKIASEIQTHEKEDWRRRFVKLTSTVHVGRWGEDETKKLLNLYQLYGNNWKVISNKLPGRSQEQIKDKVRTLK